MNLCFHSKINKKNIILFFCFFMVICSEVCWFVGFIFFILLFFWCINLFCVVAWCSAFYKIIWSNSCLALMFWWGGHKQTAFTWGEWLVECLLTFDWVVCSNSWVFIAGLGIVHFDRVKLTLLFRKGAKWNIFVIEARIDIIIAEV